MTLLFEARAADSPYIDTVVRGCTFGAGAPVRPAELHWHMVFVRHSGKTQLLIVGPWTTAGVASWDGEAEILWIKFKLGTFMPHLPTNQFLNRETPLPEASGNDFWLKNTAWELPNYENAETFVQRLAHDDLLVRDPIVTAALNNQLRPNTVAPRTVRHRFLRATGLTQKHIEQVQRAQRAAALLEQGTSILDTVHEAGYFDQPHLTRSLKRYIGKTPAQQFVPRPQRK
jgi:AraC-like DNA-binding protein